MGTERAQACGTFDLAMVMPAREYAEKQAFLPLQQKNWQPATRFSRVARPKARHGELIWCLGIVGLRFANPTRYLRPSSGPS